LAVKALSLQEVPRVVRELVEARQKARETKDWGESDRLREEIKKQGYLMEDRADGYRLTAI
jgi:cysteinyl-tRNA synthetase